MLNELWIGVETAFTLSGLAAIVAGTVIGIVIGALPGLGPSLGVALLIPLTYTMPPAVSILLLVALYTGAEYGGSISAILIATPGTAAATATVMDGYPLNRKGYPGKALGASLASSTIGGFFGTLVLMLLAAPLTRVALKFGPPEYFALGIFGITIVASLSADSPIKGLLTATLGLALTVIGVDPITGTPRLTGGQLALFEGIPYIAALIGLFAFAEVFAMVERNAPNPTIHKGIKDIFLSMRELRMILPASVRGSISGTIIGIIPGLGGSVAGWVAYDHEKRLSRTPETFGTGDMRGIAAPEAANNACVGGALVPLITLGVPGSPTTAVLMGALIMHGIQPGPQIFEREPEVVYGLFIGLMVATLAMYVIGLLATPVWVRMIAVPNAVLAPVVFALGAVGAYALRNQVFDVWLALGFGVVGYVLNKYRFPLAPMVLAMVLGDMIESNFRRSLLMSQGSHDIFFTQPITAAFLALAVLSFLWPLLRHRRRPAEIGVED